jgi:hypothetical protein
MPNSSKNDIILVRYPFSDLSGAKVRPAVVVSAPRVSRLSHLVSGMILIFSSFLGLVLPLVFNLGQRSVLEDHYKIAIYAATALGLVISVFVYGFTAAFYDHREQKGKREVGKILKK